MTKQIKHLSSLTLSGDGRKVGNSTKDQKKGGNGITMSQSQSAYSVDSVASVPFSTDFDSSETGTIKRQPSKVDQSTSKDYNTLTQQLDNSNNTTGSLVTQQQRDNSNTQLLQKLESGAYQNFEQDLSPVSLEIDSAFSDTLSLPSSGSHGSVTTSGSQLSGGSSGAHSGSSGEAGPPLSPVIKTILNFIFRICSESSWFSLLLSLCCSISMTHCYNLVDSWVTRTFPLL